MANKREKKPQWNQVLVLIVCGWITPFLHTLLIQWCRTQHARTPTPVPPRHLLKSLKYIQKKKLWDKAGTGEDMQLPQQSCGSVTSAWIPSSELKQLRLRPKDELSSLVPTETCCNDCRRGGPSACRTCPLLRTHSLGATPLSHWAPQGDKEAPNTVPFYFQSANFWANAQAFKAGCRSNEKLKFVCDTVMLGSSLYHQ